MHYITKFIVQHSSHLNSICSNVSTNSTRPDSGRGKISTASNRARLPNTNTGMNQTTSCVETISGATTEPILENITQPPTPVFLNTVGKSSPVYRYNVGVEI